VFSVGGSGIGPGGIGNQNLATGGSSVWKKGPGRRIFTSEARETRKKSKGDTKMTRNTQNTKSTEKTSTYVGGQTVAAGFYWNTKEWELETLSGKGGKLPGKADAAYVKVPAVAMLTLAPMMGAMYVMFLPFIGFALLAEHVGRKVAGAAKRGAEDVAGALIPEVRPGEAYLTGKKDGKKPAEAAGKTEKGDGEVEKLEKEIAEKRGTEKK